MTVSSVATKGITLYDPKASSVSQVDKASVKSTPASKEAEQEKRRNAGTQSVDTVNFNAPPPPPPPSVKARTQPDGAVNFSPLRPPPGKAGTRPDGQTSQNPVKATATSSKQIGLLLDRVV